MVYVAILFNGGGGFFVYDSGFVFVLMVVTMLFVYCDGWVFCL